MSNFWTRTNEHLALSQSVCSGRGCIEGNRQENDRLFFDPPSFGNCRVIHTDGSSTGSLNCTAFHLHQWLDSSTLPPSHAALRISEERGVTLGTMFLIRSVGLTPDSIFVGDVCHSLLIELGLRIDRPTYTNYNIQQFFDELSRSLTSDTRLIILLLGIDRLLPNQCHCDEDSADIWHQLLNFKPPANVALIVTCMESISSRRLSETVSWLRPASLVSVIDPDDDLSFSHHFSEFDKKFPSDLIRKTMAVLIFSSPLGINVEDVAFFLRGLIPNEDLEQLASFIFYLKPLMIDRKINNLDGLTWSESCAAFVLHRYALDDVEVLSHMARVTASRLAGTLQSEEWDYPTILNWIVRFFTTLNRIDLVEAGTVLQIVCDWRIWQVATESGVLNFLVSMVHHLASKMLDSQLWLLTSCLTWLSGALDLDYSLQHLAAQLISVLKPYADEENCKWLYQLYHGAKNYCNRSLETILIPVSNWNHNGVPMKRRGVDLEVCIQLMAVSADAQMAVFVLQDVTEPVLFSLVSHRQLAVYKGHSGVVTCVHVTGNDQQMISGSEDLTVIVWHLLSGQLICRIREHIAPVLCVTSSLLAGDMVISGGEDSILNAVQWNDGERVARIDHHRGPVTCAVINHRQDVLVSDSVFGCDQMIQPEPLWILTGKNGPHSLIFTISRPYSFNSLINESKPNQANGNTVEDDSASSSHDGLVCLWSLEDWSLLNTICITNPISWVTLSVDDIFLLIAAEDTHPRLHSLTTGSPLHAWTDLNNKVISAVIVGGNGQSVAALLMLDGQLICYDCHGGHLVQTLHIASHNITNSIKAEHFTCCRSRDSRLLFHSVDGTMQIWILRYEEKRPMAIELRDANSFTTTLTMSSDGSVLVSGRSDGLVTIWRSTLSKMGQWQHSSAITAITFDPAGLYIAAASDDGMVSTWHLNAGQTLNPRPVHNAAIVQVVITANRNGYALSCDVTETIIQWRLNSGEMMRLWKGASKALVIDTKTRWIAGLTGNHCVRLWSLDSVEHKEMQVNHTEEILCLSLTADNRNLITGSKDSSLKMWELENGRLVQVMVGHTGDVTAVVTAFITNMPHCSAQNGSKQLIVISGSRDCQLIVWDATTGSEIHILRHHRQPITCLSVSVDGSVLISGSEDGTIRAWNVRLGTNLSTFALGNPIHQIVMAPDASKICVRFAQHQVPLVLDLKRTPAVLIKSEVLSRPASPVHFRKAPAPTLRLLKKEISLDSYTWLKRYSRPPINTTPPSPPPASLVKISRRNSFCIVPQTLDDA